MKNLTEESSTKSLSQDYYLLASAAIWRKRRLIFGISIGVAIVVAIVNFFVLWPYYRATGTLLPETDKGKLASVGSLANLAELAGVSAGGTGAMARLYPAILESETVLRPVIFREYPNSRYGKPVNMLDYFQITGDSLGERFDKCIKLVRSLIEVTVDPRTNLLTITVEMPERQFAIDVLNAIVAQTDDFMRHKQSTSASEQARWIAARIDSVENELGGAEDRLKTFRERNRLISDSPDLALQLERLGRDVQVKSVVYLELKKQYELAKIDEVKSVSIVNVLDPGTAPVKKERPRRMLNIALGFLGAMALLSFFFGWALPSLAPRFNSIHALFTDRLIHS